jgi:hypothetical protein
MAGTSLLHTPQSTAAHASQRTAQCCDATWLLPLLLRRQPSHTSWLQPLQGVRHP